MLKKLITLIILYFFSSISQAYEIKLKKIISLDKPWGSSFINDDELIVTEKEGKIKIVNILNNKVSEIDQ